MSTSSRGLNILVVENHPETLKWLGMFLEDLGHRVISSRTMREGIENFSRVQCDVLISDIGLPDGDGWELMRSIHSDKPLFAIAMSGFGMSSDRVKSIRAGFRHHLLKPFVPEELESILATAQIELAHSEN